MGLESAAKNMWPPLSAWTLTYVAIAAWRYRKAAPLLAALEQEEEEDPEDEMSRV